MTNKFILKIKDKYRSKKSISTFLIKIFIFPFKFILHKIKILKKWILGRLFELIKKNKIIYKELIFSFDNPYFLTEEKGNFLFNHMSFEENQILFAEKYINRNLPLIEFGGCMGIVACITNKIIKNKHIVVEANPYIIPVLEQNKKINSCNFSIINKAVGYKNIIDYYVSKNPVDGGLYKKTPQIVSIQTITPDFRFATPSLPYSVMK